MRKIKDYILDKKFTVVAFCVDIVLFLASFLFAFFIDNLNQVAKQEADLGMTIIFSIPCLITTLTIMYFAKIYRIAWNYAGIIELLRLVAIAIVSIAVGLLYRGLFTFIYRPGVSPDNLVNADRLRPNLVIEAYLFFFLMASFYRIMAKIVTAMRNRLHIADPMIKDMQKVIVYGAGYTGASLVKRMIDHPKDGYLPVAIIDDDPSKKGKMISNVVVVGGRERIEDTVKKEQATVIAIAITNLTKKELRSIFDYIKEFNVKIFIANSLSDANSAINNDVLSMRNIKIEDLLHRDEHTMDKNLVDSFIKGKVVMVTGGAGSIGSEVCRQALLFECKHLVIFDQHENGMFEFNEELKKIYAKNKYSLEIGTVRDRQKLEEVMEYYKPDVVFHAAAYKHVPMMEISADESVKNNVMGTRNVIEQCNKSGVKKFILISTDKAINPANVMGATKRCAELVLQSYSKTSKTQLAAVRFGNVLGSSGSVIPTFIKQINIGGPITVTDRDMKRYFMTIPEAVRLVLQAGALANGGEVFVLDMGEPVYIYDLAKDLVRMSGLRPNVDIEIKITGLRPGEKLFEELQYGNENVDKTRHKDIFVCKFGNIDQKETMAKLNEMFAVAVTGDKDGTEKKLFELVPSEYRKKHKDVNARV